VDKECREFTDLRAELNRLKHRLCGEISERVDVGVETPEAAIERLAVINLELSKSIAESVKSARLVAAHGLLRWQLILWQKAFVLYNDTATYDRWKAGKQIRERELREFLRSFNNPSTDDNTVGTDAYPAIIDDDWVDFDNLSKMLHLHVDWIESMVRLTGLGEVKREDLLHLVERLLFAELRNTARFLTVVAHAHYMAVKPSAAARREINDRINSLDERLHVIRVRHSQRERELGIVEPCRNARSKPLWFRHHP